MINGLSILKGIRRRLAPYSPKALYYAYLERTFDARHGVDTAQHRTLQSLGVTGSHLQTGVDYSPTSVGIAQEVLRKLDINHSEYVFIDFGSGKGRMLLLAGMYPFKQVRGVELTRELHEMALSNIVCARGLPRRCDDMASSCVEAIAYEFPNEHLVLFFFNPFSGDVLKGVITRLCQSLAKSPRKAVIIYYYPVFSKVIEETGLFDIIAQGPRYRIYEIGGFLSL